jgi:hypothetical protein
VSMKESILCLYSSVFQPQNNLSEESKRNRKGLL